MKVVTFGEADGSSCGQPSTTERFVQANSLEFAGGEANVAISGQLRSGLRKPSSAEAHAID